MSSALGIDIVNALKLIEVSRKVGVKGRFLSLGRQGFHIRRSKQLRLVSAAAEEAGLRFDYDAIKNNNGFAEPFFEMLGFDECNSLDASDFEGANIVHDLNAPSPRCLHNRFDFVLDGGTIEHVFDAPNALRSVFTLLRTNGVFYSVNGGNGFFGHGFYQFSPELPWSFWCRSCGFEMIDCIALPTRLPLRQISLPDPHLLGARVEPELPKERVYICYTVRKLVSSKLRLVASQSDYQAKWDGLSQIGCNAK